MATRHKPTLEARAATRAASDADYEKLAQAVVRAIILKQKDVIYKVPYFTTFADDFPKGLLIKKDEQCNWYRAKAFKLADWLHKHSYLDYDAKAIVLSTRQIVYKIANINKMLDSNVKMCDNDDLKYKEEKDGHLHEE